MELLRSYAAVPEDFFEMNTALVWLACRLYSEFRNWDIGSELIAEGLTLEMLAHSARSEVEKEKRPTAWLRQVIERLNDDYLDTPSTESLARDAGVHPVHLAAVFRKYKKQTINEYVQQLRVGHASKLLSDKEKTLADIALTCGFSDQSHFTRMFKRVTGMTPGAFRKSLA